MDLTSGEKRDNAIGQSVVVFVAIGLITLLVINGMSVWLVARAQSYSLDVLKLRDTRVFSVELRNALQAAESSQRGFLVSGNEIYLAPFDNAKASAQKYISLLETAMSRYPERSAMMSRLSSLVANKLSEMTQSVELRSDLKYDEALNLFRSNRGKALMDEANVYLSSIIRTTDDSLTQLTKEQERTSTILRLASFIGTGIIVLVVAGIMIAIYRYASAMALARDQVRDLNKDLEKRVEARTFDLAKARERAETLLAEVNHRVANSLSLIASMVRLQSIAVRDTSAKQALEETEARIHAIAAVHKQLYTSGDVTSVALDDYLVGLLQQLERSMQSQGSNAALKHDIEPIRLPTNASINLGVIVTELVTNAFKYAYPMLARGEVRVRLNRRPDGGGELWVEDDGAGLVPEERAKGTGLGTKLVKAMTESIGGEINYAQAQPGTRVHVTFPISAEAG